MVLQMMQAEVLRQARTDEAKLAAAKAARTAGDIRRAVVLYRSLAFREPPSKETKAAKDGLTELGNEGLNRLAQISYDINKGKIAEAFAELRRLDRDYSSVPEAGREIRNYLNRMRRRDDVAAVLNEPDAKEFWDQGQQHERSGALCCAYLTYEEGRKLAPAPSALKARERFEKLSADPEIVESANRCATLQQCHHTYRRAERLIAGRPERAAELFREVLQKAPPDTEIHVAARKQLAALD
jgi:hypothetical protein